MGYRIPKGTPLILAPYSMHLSPHNYVAPQKFWPDRWMSETIPAEHLKDPGKLLLVLLLLLLLLLFLTLQLLPELSSCAAMCCTQQRFTCCYIACPVQLWVLCNCGSCLAAAVQTAGQARMRSPACVKTRSYLVHFTQLFLPALLPCLQEQQQHCQHLKSHTPQLYHTWHGIVQMSCVLQQWTPPHIWHRYARPHRCGPQQQLNCLLRISQQGAACLQRIQKQLPLATDAASTAAGTLSAVDLETASAKP